MKTNIRSSAILISLAIAQSTCAQGFTQRGAVLGGLTGAGVGAVIGDNNDDAGAGALIGGAVGALAGSVLGNSRDQQYQYRAQAYQQQQAYRLSRAVSVSDVVALTHNRLSEGVILNLIQNNGLQQPLQVSDIVYLNQQGVSDNVIRVMQDMGSGRMAPPVVYENAPPVVVSRVYAVPAPAPVYVPSSGFYYNYSSCGGHYPHHHRYYH